MEPHQSHVEEPEKNWWQLSKCMLQKFQLWKYLEAGVCWAAEFRTLHRIQNFSLFMTQPEAGSGRARATDLYINVSGSWSQSISIKGFQGVLADTSFHLSRAEGSSGPLPRWFLCRQGAAVAEVCPTVYSEKHINPHLFFFSLACRLSEPKFCVCV